MATISGSVGDVYIATGAGTPMTTEACTSLSATIYQITSAAHRYIDPSTAVLVYANAVLQDPATYNVFYASGKIVFDSAPTAPVTITGAYLTVSQLGQCFDWSLNVGHNLVDASMFGSSWEEKAATLGKGTVSVKRFYADNYFYTNISNFLVLALYVNQSVGMRYMAVTRLNASQISEGITQLVGEDLTFATHGPVDFAST